MSRGTNELTHYGVKGMKWGVRRYRNKDGSLTPAGEAKRAKSSTSGTKKARPKSMTKAKTRKSFKNIPRNKGKVGLAVSVGASANIARMTNLISSLAISSPNIRFLVSIGAAALAYPRAVDTMNEWLYDEETGKLRPNR